MNSYSNIFHSSCQQSNAGGNSLFADMRRKESKRKKKNDGKIKK